MKNIKDKLDRSLKNKIRFSLQRELWLEINEKAWDVMNDELEIALENQTWINLYVPLRRQLEEEHEKH